MTITTFELKWLKSLLHLLSLLHPRPMRMFSDSQSPVNTAKNHVFEDRTKHI